MTVYSNNVYNTPNSPCPPYPASLNFCSNTGFVTPAIPNFVLVGFEYTLEYYSTDEVVFSVATGSTTTTYVSMAFEAVLPSSKGLPRSIQIKSLIYPFGWPNYNFGGINRICITSTAASNFCFSNIYQRPIYYTSPLVTISFTDYSSLRVINFNPISIGLVWFVPLFLSFFHFFFWLFAFKSKQTFNDFEIWLVTGIMWLTINKIISWKIMV